MSNSEKEQGFVHLLPILVIGLLAFLLTSSSIPINKHYNDGKSNVAGVYVTKGADMKKADVRIATEAGQTAFVSNRAGALSNFPLSVNPKTGELTVTTPAGTKVVAVLPQQAIDNMLASHVMTDVTSEKVNNSLASIPNLVKLEIRNEVLGYWIKGTKTHKLLGIIPLKSGVEVFVSAENGQVVETQQSLLARFLNRIAP